MSITVSPAVAFAYGYSSVQAAEADTEFLASLPDDSEPKTALQVEMEDMWAQAAEAQAASQADSRPATIYAKMEISLGTVTVYNEGAWMFTPYEQGEGSAAVMEQFRNSIDWDNLDTPEERTAAIVAEYSGKLMASDFESGEKGMTSELMSKMFSSDALINRMFLTEDGGSIEDNLAETDQASSSATATAAGDLQAVQTQAAAA